MMRFLKISLIFIILFSSCAVPVVKGLPAYKSGLTEFSNPYFANTNTDYVYKAKINAYGNILGGILIIKKIKSNNHRIVFTTNFGNKIFDFELIDNDVKTHFILEEMDRKIIIKTLQRDFKTLTQEDHSISKAYKKNQSIIYQSKTENRFNYLLIAEQTKVLSKIVHASKFKEKIIISFLKIKNNIAQSINITHRNAPIEIDLNYLDNN